MVVQGVAGVKEGTGVKMVREGDGVRWKGRIMVEGSSGGGGR